MKILFSILGWFFSCVLLIAAGFPADVVSFLSLALVFVIIIRTSNGTSGSHFSSYGGSARTSYGDSFGDDKDFEEIAMLDLLDGEMDGNFDIFNTD